MTTLTMNQDGKIEVKPRRLIMQENEILLAEVEITHWVPNMHPRWPAHTIQGTENVGGQFMHKFDTEDIKSMLGAPPSSGPSDTKVDLGWWVKDSQHIKELQLFTATGQTGEKVVARMRLDTVVPKQKQASSVHTGLVKIADLQVGDQFTDALGKNWEVTGDAGEGYVKAKPIGDNATVFHAQKETRLLGKADVTLIRGENPVEPPAEVDDGKPPEMHSVYAAFVVDYNDFTLEGLAKLLTDVDNGDTISSGHSEHHYKISPVEGNYSQHVAAKTGQDVSSSSASTGQAIVFARQTASNTPDDTPHDSSIELHSLSHLTSAQWETFGANDQKRYNDLMEKYGSLKEDKGHNLVYENKQKANSSATNSYNISISNQSGSGKQAADLGHIFDVNEGFNVYASNYPDQTKEKYLDAEKLFNEVQDISQWDLYNRVGEPNILIFHLNDSPWKVTKQQALEGKLAIGAYPFYGGLSWTTNVKGMLSFGNGDSIIIARMPINRIGFFHIVQEIHSTHEAEYVVREEMFFDPKNTIFSGYGGGGGTWEGTPESWQKLMDMSTTETPQPGSRWSDAVGYWKGYTDPPKPLSEFSNGEFFSTDNAAIWSIDSIDEEGIHATEYLDGDGDKIDPKVAEAKTFTPDQEFPKVTPIINAKDLSLGEIVEDSEGNQWQNAGLHLTNYLILIPFKVNDGYDPHTYKLDNSDTVKLVSLAEKVPDWIEEYKSHKQYLVEDMKEGAIVLAPWGQKYEIIAPSKHGNAAKGIKLDENENQIPDTQVDFAMAQPVAMIKAGHPPLPPPKPGENVVLSRLSAGDVFEYQGDEVKVLGKSENGVKAIYSFNTSSHIRGELRTLPLDLKAKFVRKEDPEVYAGIGSGFSTYIDDLNPGDTFYFEGGYYKFGQIDGGNVIAENQNPIPGGAKIVIINTYHKVFPSGIPSKPVAPYLDESKQIPFADLKQGDWISFKSSSGTLGDPMIVESTGTSAGNLWIRAQGYRWSEQDLQHGFVTYNTDSRPTKNTSVVGKSLWIGDIVQAPDGQKLKVAKSPTVYDYPFVDVDNGDPDTAKAYPTSNYYTYLSSNNHRDDLHVEAPSGKSYDTPMKDVKQGHVIQTTNGSKWLVDDKDGQSFFLLPVDEEFSPKPGAPGVLVKNDSADPVAILNRTLLSDLKPGDTWKNNDESSKVTFVVIDVQNDQARSLPITDWDGKSLVVSPPGNNFVMTDPATEIITLGPYTNWPVEAAPQPGQTDESAFVKKSPAIGEVELWNPGSLVISGNHFYLVGPSHGGKTQLTDMAGQQHEVNSKNYLVKSASGGPKPVKGLHLFVTDDISPQQPKKGEFFFWNGKTYVMLKPQIKAATVQQVDESGSSVGQPQSITYLGTKNIGNYAIQFTKVSGLKQGETVPLKYSEPWEPNLLEPKIDPSLIKGGDTVIDTVTGQRLKMLGGQKYVADRSYVQLDKFGNSTGIVLPSSEVEEHPLNMVTDPDGQTSASQIAEDNMFNFGGKTLVAVKHSGIYLRAVDIQNMTLVNVMKTARVTPLPDPYVPKPGAFNFYLAKNGDIVEYGGMKYEIIGAGGSSIYSNNLETGQSKYFYIGDPINLVKAEKRSLLPTFWPGKDETPEAPETPLPTKTSTSQVGDVAKVKDLADGTNFSYTSWNGEKFYWKKEDGHFITTLRKLGTNPNQPESITLIPSDDIMEMDVNVVNDPDNSPMPVLLTPKDISAISAMKESMKENSTGWQTFKNTLNVGDSFEMKMLGVFKWKVAEGAPGGQFKLTKIGNNLNQAHAYTTTKETWISNKGYNFQKIEPEDLAPPEQAPAKAFVDAVDTRTRAGSKRLDATLQTAAEMNMNPDSAIDSFKAANVPPSGTMSAMKDLQVGDTYKILTGTHAGWQWKIVGTNDTGGWNLDAVDKQDKQPAHLTSFSASVSSTQVEKVGNDNPSATLDPEALKPGQIFQVKVDTGEVFTWKVIETEDDMILLQAVGSVKGTSQKKTFITKKTIIEKNLESGLWLPV